MFIRSLQIAFSLQIFACSPDRDVTEPEPLSPDIGVVTELAGGLTSPWGLAFLPDRSVLISSRTTAQIHRVPAAGGTPQLVGTVPGVSVTAEGGLLGIVASPGFNEDST
ncbi:MAG: hypothetical protein EOO94_02615, partial [Pedobacter sp.]